MMDEIESRRVEIDRLDVELLQLLNYRVRLAIEIGRMKKAT